MNTNLISLIVLFGWIFLSSCASSGPMVVGNAEGKVFQSTQNEDRSKAILYFYRPTAFGSGLAAPLILIDQKKVVLLKNGGYTKVALAPRKYLIETDFNSAWVYGKKEGYEISVEGGRNYFVQVRAKTIVIPTFNPFTLFFSIGTQFKLVQMNESDAFVQIEGTRFLEPIGRSLF